ncbi:MAG TPA: glycosyltransferase family 87 protein [Methylomirabilota bacterium]|nr:glycosyltransferase family 87 protein [Methylomirabilota bacterium]
MTGRVPAAVLALALIVAALGGRFAVHALQAARNGDARDFAILYTAGHLYRQGVGFYEPDMNNVEGVNRNAALVAEARRLGTLHAHEGLLHIHQFSYPPFAVLPFVPFTWLGWRHAVMAWQALSVLLLVAAFFWVARAARLGSVPALTLAAVFLAWEPLENSVGLGQINQLVLALVALFVWALVSGRPALGGLALGAATALRFHPALFIAWLAWRRQWTACGVAAATAVVCTALATATVGWPATLEYATRVAPQYGYAAVSGQLGNLSLTGWMVATGHGLLPGVPMGAWRGLGAVASLVALGAAVAVLRPPGAAPAPRLVAEAALLSVVLLLVAPNTTINHLVFTLLPLAVLIDATLREGAAGRAAALAAAVVLIGAIDDYYQHPGLTAGPAVLLAGIKTYGLAILAVLAATLLRVPAETHATQPAGHPLSGATRA